MSVRSNEDYTLHLLCPMLWIDAVRIALARDIAKPGTVKVNSHDHQTASRDASALAGLTSTTMVTSGQRTCISGIWTTSPQINVVPLGG